jgi:CRP-like cAMP-binding protein
MQLIDLLRNVEILEGLNDKQLKKIARVFRERILHSSEVLFRQGDKANHLYIIKSGFVEVSLDSPTPSARHPIRNLGLGQTVGEMSWIDRGVRSATVRAVTDSTIIAYVSFEALDELCKRNPKIGYLIFRNLAADLSFRLRQDTGGR